MQFSVSGKAPDTGFADEVKRVFTRARAAAEPVVVRALDAIEAFVIGAPLNIPQGSEMSFASSGQFEHDGRGALSVSVTIDDTPIPPFIPTYPPLPAPRAEPRRKLTKKQKAAARAAAKRAKLAAARAKKAAKLQAARDKKAAQKAAAKAKRAR